MWQRCYDFYNGLEGAEQRQVGPILDRVPGLEDLLNQPLQLRVERVENKLRAVDR